MKKFFQKLGKSMLVSIVAMPIAGLLLRISADDLLNIPILGAAGNAIFGNLDLLFGIGIVMGFVKEKDKGLPVLTLVAGLLTFKEGLKIINESVNMGVFAGITIGLLSAWTYDKFKNTKLPNIFAFFSGNKFPIIMIMLLSTLAAVVFGNIWPYLQDILNKFTITISSLGAIGVAIYAFFNRLLIPTGLHHVLNTYIYFEMGEFTNKAGEVVRGEIPAFIAGDPGAGFFLSQFFVIMMFGIPAIAYAIYRTSKKDQKESTKGLMYSGALTSFISGITEPIEFSFMFSSPFLYFLHAVFTGLVGAICYLLNIRIGFSFGSGIIDYILNFQLADGAWKVIPLGIAVFIVYYLVFYNYIIRKDVKLIGRMDTEKQDFSEQDIEYESKNKLKNKDYYYVAKTMLKAFGGKDNIEYDYNCITRLRVTVKNPDIVDEQLIKNTGAIGIYKPTDDQFQVVIGTEVANVASEFEKLL
ncbi:PTS transporter subunit EIIC [Helcococcus kunzii]|uniref:PTS transporter subunit EIIC n=1 Tax=Helcococcus kunzii TaxID=40091 RepID=UPI0038A916B9